MYAFLHTSTKSQLFLFSFSTASPPPSAHHYFANMLRASLLLLLVLLPLGFIAGEYHRGRKLQTTKNSKTKKKDKDQQKCFSGLPFAGKSKCNGIPSMKPSLLEDKCNGNGIFNDADASLGEPARCRCNACVQGEFCEGPVLDFDDPECTVNPDDPDLDYYREWYDTKTDAISVFYPSYGMRYRNFNTIDEPEEGIEGDGLSSPLNSAFYKAVKKVHEMANNVDFENNDYKLVVGMGGHQLLTAAIFALAKIADKEVEVTSREPKWSRFPTIANYAHTKYATWVDSGSIGDSEKDTRIEIVTLPNHTDNKRYSSLYEKGKKIFDCVFNWPNVQLPGDIKPESEDIMIFSMSKLAVLPDMRIGWAWVKDEEVANVMNSFISHTVQSVSGVPLHRSTKILQEIAKSEDDGENEFFEFARTRLLNRYNEMKSLIDSRPENLSVISDFGIFFPIQCNDFEGIENGDKLCEDLLKEVGILPINRLGSRAGYDASDAIVVTCVADDEHDYQIYKQKMTLLVDNYDFYLNNVIAN